MPKHRGTHQDSESVCEESMIITGNANDLNFSTNRTAHNRKHTWLHVAIVGGMAVSLGSAVVTGVKKSTTAHIVSALCFMGMVILHLLTGDSYRRYKVVY